MRRITACGMAVVCLVAIGCGATEAAPLVGPARARTSLEEALRISLAEVAPLPEPAYVNVEATYVGVTSTERITLIVFNDPRATAQLGDPAHARGRFAVVGNTAVLYDRDPNTPDRMARIRRTLQRLVAGA